MRTNRFVQGLKIAQKLPLYIVGAGFAVGLSIGISTYFNAADSLEQARQDQLVTALEARRTALHTLLNGIDQDLQIIASSVTTRWAMMGFSEGWSEFEEQPTENLRQLYVEGNPHPEGRRAELDAAEDDSTYSEVHGLYHPWFREYLNKRSYADVFLLDVDGNLVYSVSKSLDFATNLDSGQWRETGLGEAFRIARDRPETGFQVFVDFSKYGASKGAPSSFMATPILDEDDTLLGVLALQMSASPINKVLQQAAGLGETGETYLVGADFLMRSDSRFAETPTMLSRRVEMEAVRKALSGEHGFMFDTDGAGQSVMAAFAPLDFSGLRWALLGQMTEDEIMQPVAELGLQTVIISAIVMALLFVLSWFLAMDIVRPLRAILDAIAEMAKGNEANVPGERRTDEIGELARSTIHVYQKGLEAARLRSALDGCSTMVMVVNRNSNVVYVNDALQAMLDDDEAVIQRDQPDFSAGNLLGSHVGEVHPALAEFDSNTTSLEAVERRQIRVGDRRLNITVTPVLANDGRYLGMVIEWIDATLELTMQEAIDRVIDAASQGDFSQRVDLDGVDGVYQKLGDGMNRLTAMIAEAADDLGTMLEAMAKGDLSKRIEADFKGKLGELKGHANSTADKLTEIVGLIQAAADEVRSAVLEINAGTEDLSQRTRQAASNLKETAESTEEMASTVRQNAENAKNASQLAGTADKSAKTGGQVVEQAVDAMVEIERSAQRITDIIGVIDEIAFQTNLLALNASVEAARAGEAGKGFAVVAQEVRQLAQRSAQAANDIKTLIQDSNSQVEDGVQLVNRAGKALTEIVGSIGKVACIVQEISSASQEQTKGVQEINGSIAGMDAMTQKNSALVQESKSASLALSDQAMKLADLMAFFKLDEGTERQLSTGSRKPSQNQKKSTALVPAGNGDSWGEF